LFPFLAAWSWSCSEPVVGPSSLRVPVTVASGTWPEPVETVVLSLPLPERLEPGGWFTIDNDTAEVALVPDPALAPAAAREAPPSVRAIRLLPPKKPFFLRIPLDLDASAFDLVRVRYKSAGFARVAALVGRGTKRYTLGDFIERNEIPGLVEVDLDMSMLVKDDRHLSELHVVFEVLTAEAQVFSVDLIKRSASLRLPSPFELAEHVAIGTGSRRAVGLLPGIEVEGVVPPGARGSLALEASLPPAVPASEEATMSIELFIGQRSLQVVTFPLDSRWSTHSIELDEITRSLPAGTVLSFRVHTNSPLGALLGPTRVLAGPRPPGAPPPRTVTLITSDTHRADHLGCAPNGVGVKTPTLDRLAADGVCFTNATSVSSITNPSHAAIFTGKHVRDTGIVGNLVPLGEQARTLAEEFRAAGWRTFASVSARHLMPWRSGFGQGFARFDAPEKAMTRDAIETLAQARAMLADAEHHDVFLWLHLFEAHAPYDPQGEWTELYYTGDPYSEELPELQEPVRPAWDKRVRDESYLRALYKGEISYLDQSLQSFFDDVPRVRAGCVVFTADHGESLGENQLYWDHSAIYPSTLRVPLIVAGPRVPAGATVGAHVSNRDVAKTLLALAGLEKAVQGGEPFPGRSLLDQIAPERPGAEEPWFVIGEGGLSAGMFFERWYLLLHLRGKAWGNPAFPVAHQIELYDRESDPDCTDNVVLAHPDEARELRAVLVHWLADLPEEGLLTGAPRESASARADIAALGYAADAPSEIEGALIDPLCECPQCALYR
jgi:arylsulfatase A-like enzyme